MEPSFSGNILILLAIFLNRDMQTPTRLHSSRMRTGRLLTVCCSLLPGGVLLDPGGSAWSGGVLLGPVGGGISPWSRGGSPWSRGGLLGPGGSAWSGEGSPWSRGGSPETPPCGQNHRHL